MTTVNVLEVMRSDAMDASLYRREIDADRGKSALSDSREAQAAVADVIVILNELNRMGGLGFRAHDMIDSALSRIGGWA